jgi:hypothetical protein
MTDLLARPEVAGRDHLDLACQPGLIPYDRRFGFAEQVGRSTLMRRSANTRLLDGPR